MCFLILTAFMNLVETALNILYLYLAHISHWPAASLIGFASAVMTLSKTILYWAQEYYCNYCAVGHNEVQDILVFWVFPNGYAYVICGFASDLLRPRLWIIFPSLIVYQLGKDLVGSLNHVAVKEAVHTSLEPRKKEM